jgi:uncharacterized protein YciI
MWIVELSFSGGPERLAARGAHRDSLTRLHDQGIVRLAGPYADGSGALIVFDVPDQAKLDEIMAQDPYFTTEGVHVRQIREWGPFLT